MQDQQLFIFASVASNCRVIYRTDNQLVEHQNSTDKDDEIWN